MKTINEIVDNVVKEVVNEISINKKKQLANKGLGAIEAKDDNVRTFCIITGENPMAQRGSNRTNRANQNDLAKVLRNGGFAWIPLRGKYGNTENPKMIFNITIEDAKTLATKYQQESFIFGTKEDGKTLFDLWMTNADKSGYEMVERQEKYIDMADADDFYTVIANKKKFNIPYEYFNEGFVYFNNKINEAKKNSRKYNANFERFLDESMNPQKTMQSRYLKRSLIYKGMF